MNSACINEMPLREAIAPDMIGDTGMIFVDFDHTLFGCNSTEIFIGSCKPSGIVALIDILVRVCIPWKLTGIKHWYRIRDFVCVVAILILTPWNAIRWKRIAPGLFSKYENLALTELLAREAEERVVIVSFGLDFIIRGLVARSNFSRVRLLATRLASKPTLFLRGKLFIVQQCFDSVVIADSTFITDSTDDNDLMEQVELPLLIRPYGERYQAGRHLYVPLRYTVTAKYPLFYAIDQLLFVDLPIAVIAVSDSVLVFLHTLVVAPFLLVSLMCVYEAGYFENDMRAAKAELNPTLSGKEGSFAEYPVHINAWIWSLSLSAIGVLIAVKTGALSQSSAVVSYCYWNAVLILIRLVFVWYNNLSVLARIYVYPFLQLLKYGAIVAIFTPTSTGTMLILAQTFTMYLIYVVYRFNGDRHALPREQIRLIIFVVAVAALLTQRSYSLSTQTFALVMATAWLSFRIARSALVRMYKSRHQSELKL